jgi:hypothetical protein
VGLFLSLFLSLPFSEDRASNSRGRFGRRLISLIFAGRNRIILIRGELPLTKVASPAELSHDAFAAAFLHGYDCGWPIRQTAHFANALGALVASHAGATPDWIIAEVLAMAAPAASGDST